MNVEDLIELNFEKLEYAKNNQDSKTIEICEKIASILEKDPAIFFKIDMESALKILIQLIPEKEVKSVYESLISPDSFKELRKKSYL